MVSPLIISRKAVVNWIPGITSIILPIMILSGCRPIPSLTKSSTARAVRALQAMVWMMLLSFKEALA